MEGQILLIQKPFLNLCEWCTGCFTIAKVRDRSEACWNL